MASFRRFPDVPKELRDMAWDYAPQRNIGGVQIFELQTPEPKQDGETSDTKTPGTRPLRQQLATPLPSKYFPALDTACKESRDIMEKTAQRTKKILANEAKKIYRSFEDAEHLPAMLRCSTLQQFLVQPHADLFALQPSKIEDINWP
ncbi:hypothetical protein FGADI_381 [Fusarium gaditjirri]|uniref:2EXR domain-containing protein n=1 Tax=Fusarium gaditjirri TaxID=282569 RepID=A0A8H4X4I6_9HYPO|nr:hypothetical protein FGADI_381 [Fusarium gaditjirri]